MPGGATTAGPRFVGFRPRGHSRTPPNMRFYEFESRRLVERAGIPVTSYGFCKTAAEARDAAEKIGGPTVIKSRC